MLRQVNERILLIIVCPFVPLLLAIVLSVLLRFTDSDNLFGIFKLFLALPKYLQTLLNIAKEYILPDD
jgi:hypothetical protein